MSVIRRDFLPDDLAPLLKENQIDGCIAVQADQSLEETRFLLDLANQHQFIKGVVGWIDFRAKDISEQLSGHERDTKLVGFRHILQSERDNNFMLGTDFLTGIAALKAFDFTYDILIFPKHLATARKLVRKFANQPFVLDHIAKPYIQKGLVRQWERDIRSLAMHDNVWCKLSGIITEADWTIWTHEQIEPYLEIVLEAFGANRLMFGSDWPVCLLAGSYSRVVSLIKGFVSTLSGSEQDCIWGLNAKRFYGLSA